MPFPTEPLVSVLIGTYYRNSNISSLQRSITSILNQSYTNIECLVCDDGSSPEASEYLDQKAAQDHRLLLVRPGNAMTLPTKLNHCLRHAKGDYIARMDDDDFSHTDRIERQIEFLRTHTEIAFVGCNVTLVQGGIAVGQRCFPAYPSIRDFYITQPYIHPSLLFRKEALLAVGGYSESPNAILCEDYDLLLRLYGAGYRGANLQEPLLDYTIPTTAKGSRKMRHRWNEAVTRYHRFRELGLLPEALPYVVKPLAVGLLPERVLRRIKERR